ncbi:MAG: ABC-F family ATP-binding cassette domain-containing protein, partial [Polyangiales bacterium]
MPALTAKNLKKSFGPQVVLEDASFSLARGEKVALIGANGAGKSTLAKILASEEPADGGTVSVRRGLTITYLAQEPALDPDKSAKDIVEDALTAWRAATVRHAAVTAELDKPDTGKHDALLTELSQLAEDIERLGGWDQGHRALSMLDKLGVVDVDRPVGQRSGGERRRIAIARLLVARPDVAILDEPTNHLDADTAEWLEGHLAREFPGAIILVTHDRYFLDAISQRIVELERGRLTSYDGNYSAYLEKKSIAIEHENRVESNRQNILRREREWLARGPKARTTKQKARIQRAEALIDETAANAGRPGQVSLSTSTARQGKTILECRGLSLSIGDRKLVDNFDLFVAAGERIGIIGPNGVGKTTFLRALLGENKPAGGEIIVGKNTKIAYLDQARAQLDDDKSI